MSQPDLSQWLARSGASTQMAQTILAISEAGKEIAGLLRTGSASQSAGPSIINVQGEAQKPMDRLADERFIAHLRDCGAVSILVSEEQDDALVLRAEAGLGVSFDPLDGSSNLEINGPVGSIFSLVQVDANATAQSLLVPGRDQVAAGYILYGAATNLVVAIGKAVAGFILDDDTFRCTHPEFRVPPSNREYAVNASREPYWHDQTRRYIAACIAGPNGPFAAAYNTRWNAAFVAEIHRILLRGGIFLYPVDIHNRPTGGRLRLLYEANPMAFIIRAAGGDETTGQTSILELTPHAIHQRTGVVIGSADEIHRYLV